MKKIWEKPNLNKLGVEHTEALEPIILIQGQNDEFETLPLYPLRAWKCPCCHEKSEYIFESEADLIADFTVKHVPYCKKYDRITDSCIIS